MCYCNNLQLISSSFNDLVKYLTLSCIQNTSKVEYRWIFKIKDENWPLNTCNLLQWDKLWLTVLTVLVRWPFIWVNQIRRVLTGCLQQVTSISRWLLRQVWLFVVYNSQFLIHLSLQFKDLNQVLLMFYALRKINSLVCLTCVFSKFLVYNIVIKLLSKTKIGYEFTSVIFFLIVDLYEICRKNWNFPITFDKWLYMGKFKIEHIYCFLRFLNYNKV